MRVLLIGGTGVLGRAIAREAILRGHELVTLADDSGPFPPPEGVARHLRVDRNNEAAMRAGFAGWADGMTWDLVIDAVCYSESQAEILHSLIAGRTSRLIVISSTIVYSGNQLQPIVETGKTAAPAVIGQYGIGKLAIERFWSSRYPESGIAPTILRLPHVLGVGAELGPVPIHNRDPFLTSRIRDGKPLCLVDGGRQLLQVVFNEDVARLALDITHDPNTFGELFNCCNPEAIPAHAYYHEIASILGMELKIVDIPLKAVAESTWGWVQTAYSRVVSVDKLRNRGIVCRTPVRTSIDQTLRHLLERGAETDPLDSAFVEIVHLTSSAHAELANALTRASSIRKRTAVDRRMNG